MESQATILVVDDSPENLQVISAVLKEHYKVKVAINGERALALATAAAPPDRLFRDGMMPRMAGYEVCSRLKAHPATARSPVLFVSSRDEEEDEARGLSMGAIDYIVKPIRPSIVQARVRNHIELKRSRDLLERLRRRASELRQPARCARDVHLQPVQRGVRAHLRLSESGWRVHPATKVLVSNGHTSDERS